jgi:CRP/FNR family transcriptional regulator, anaerobic regulatory protein
MTLSNTDLEISSTLKKLFPFFEAELLRDLIEFASLKKVNTGDLLIRKGELINNMMLVLKGNIKIYRENDEGAEFFMYYLNPGQACAISMICMAGIEKSSITAVATEDSLLLSVPLPQMEKWAWEYKSWYDFVVGTYRSRFEELLQVLDQVAFRNMDERLEFYLKRQSRQGDLRIIQISHQQIANDLNSTREVISRLLKKMEQRGLLKLNRNNIELGEELLRM